MAFMTTIAAFFTYCQVVIQNHRGLINYHQLGTHTLWFIFHIAGIVILVYNASQLTNEVNILVITEY